jgi:hypothetical protein
MDSPQAPAPCPEWCDHHEDHDGQLMHVQDWDGVTVPTVADQQHLLARAVCRIDGTKPAAVQVAAYLDGTEVVLTLPAARADEAAGVIAGTATDAQRA